MWNKITYFRKQYHTNTYKKLFISEIHLWVIAAYISFFKKESNQTNQADSESFLRWMSQWFLGHLHEKLIIKKAQDLL